MSITLIKPASAADLGAIEALRRADGADLGFVPKAKYEHITNRTIDRGRYRFEYETLVVAVDNGDITGFCLAGFHRNGLKIEQICVRNDARRMERALMLLNDIESEAERRNSKRSLCRVASDIEANLFWVAAGYAPIGERLSTFLNVRESKSRRKLIIYRKALCQLDLPLVDIPGNT